MENVMLPMIDCFSICLPAGNIDCIQQYIITDNKKYSNFHRCSLMKYLFF